MLACLAGLGEARLRYVCDTSPDARRAVAPLYPGVRCVPSLELALDDPEVQAVLVLTPPSTHAALAMAALERGRHAFVEKPLTLQLGEAARLLALARHRRLVLATGHLLTHHPALAELHALLQAGELGSLEQLLAFRGGALRATRDCGAWWTLAPHDLSLLDGLLGSAPSSVLVASDRTPGLPLETRVHATLGYPSAVKATLDLAQGGLGQRRRLYVLGSRKLAVFDAELGSRALSVRPRRGPLAEELAQPLPASPAEPVDLLALELRHFFACVRGDAQAAALSPDPWRVMQALDAGERSLRGAGLEVRLAPASEVRPSPPG